MRPKYHQGIFKPSHPEKYRGSQPIIYRSGLELKFMRKLDANPNVISWGSESIIIPYPDPFTGKLRRYFVDNHVVMKDPKTGEIRKYLIEIKPLSQCSAPKVKRQTKSTLFQQAAWVKNQAKWKAATEWCTKRGDIKFMLITEKDLGN